MLNLLRQAIIRKEKDGYHVYSDKKHKGKRRHLGGPYKTREQAKKRLKQIEFFKHKKSFLDIEALNKIAFKLREFLPKEQQEELKELQLNILKKDFPNYDENKEYPRNFVVKEITPELVEEIGHSLLKNRVITIKIKGVQFKVFRTKNGRVIDEIISKHIDPEDYYKKHILEYTLLKKEDIENMLKREMDFAESVSKHNKKFSLKNIIKNAIIEEEFSIDKYILYQSLHNILFLTEQLIEGLKNDSISPEQGHYILNFIKDLTVTAEDALMVMAEDSQIEQIPVIISTGEKEL